MAFTATGVKSVKKYNKHRGIYGYKAGGAINEGDAIYLDSSSTWQLAKADAIATQADGIASRTVSAAQATAADDTALIACYPDCEVDGYTGGGTPGVRVYLSAATAGLVTVTQPATATNAVQILGKSLTGTRVKFDVKYTEIVVQAAATSTAVLG